MIDTYLSEIMQFGFAAVVAFTMIYILWKIVIYGIDAFDRIDNRHGKDMEKAADLHRQERKACYDHQADQVTKFDETIRLVTERYKVGGG